jgi:molybdopterin-guanine dinucleotide biosynthesis protein A
MLGDIYDIRGPMTGILTSLLNSPEQWVFVSACDMPFINIDLIQYMASGRKGFDAVVPVLKGKAEPLFSLYSKRLLTSMEKAVLSDNKSLKDFLSRKRVQYITTGEIKRFDPEAVSFINLNTPRDIDLYLKHKDKLRFKRKQRGG